MLGDELTSPATLVGRANVSDLLLEHGADGRSVQIVQVEFERFISTDAPLLSCDRVTASNLTLPRADLLEVAKNTIHATAVGSLINNPIYGILPGKPIKFAGPRSWKDFVQNNITDALTSLNRSKTCSINLQPGDIVTISMQKSAYTQNGDVSAYLPIDFDEKIKAAIQDLVFDLGVSVFIAAGNGSINLDTYQYYPGSDAIMIENYVERRRISPSGAFLVGYCDNLCSTKISETSNYGSAVDFFLPAMGMKAEFYDFEGTPDERNVIGVPTAGFSRSSAATPMVAAVFAMVQSLFKTQNDGTILTPEELRQIAYTTALEHFWWKGRRLGVMPNIEQMLEKVSLK